MPGAQIPDDWDGSTYECTPIIWPASVLWRAILLGQITECAKNTYWNADTGNPEDAADNAWLAYLQTIPNWFTPCQEVAQVVSCFRARRTQQQPIIGQAWTTIEWQGTQYSVDNPGFNLGSYSHNPTQAGVDKLGLWTYKLALSFNYMGLCLWMCKLMGNRFLATRSRK